MPHRKLASSFARMDLQHPPIALALVESPPAGIPRLTQPAISTCGFWRLAEREVFYASAQDHGGCAVGAHVMGMPLSASVAQELGAAVTLMAEVGYLPSSEVAHIPQVNKACAGVVYGPVHQFPLAPDCVVVWANPAQAMVLGEALQTTTWKPAEAEHAAMFGRPACGAVARSMNSAREVLSLGCVGMRTFTEIAPALALMVVPGEALATLAANLDHAMDSNERMRGHYLQKKNAHA